MSDPVYVLLCTAPSTEAESLARGLVGLRLAACVNILPSVQSVYRWEGEITTDRESLLVIKTVATSVQAASDWIEANHSYSVPEVLAIPTDGDKGNTSYLSWVRANVQPVPVEPMP